MVIDEDLYKKIEKITCTDYEGWLDKEKEQVLVGSDGIIGMLEDLLCEIDYLKERYNDLEKDVQDNYKPISPYEMYGISERDFY